MAIGVGAYVALYLLGILLVPALFQKFVVQPNELKLETPYLKRYIEFTRKAYKLDAIQETSYPAMEDLTPEAIARNQGTIQNIRLWDVASAASDLSADSSHTSLLPVLQRGCGSLPSGGRLSPGDAFDPRAICGTPCQSANVGEPKPAIHAWRGRRHELCLENHPRRVSGVSD